MNYLVRSRMANDIDRFFDNLFNDVPDFKSRTPVVDVRESEESYILEAELPGLSEKDIEVKVEGNLLTIASARTEEKNADSHGYVIRERREKTFRRSFVLPKDVDATNINAHFKNGLLTLELNKAPEAKPRNIEVKVN